MVSFTVEAADLWQEGPTIDVQFGLSDAAKAAFAQAGEPIPPPVHVSALIDTGASQSLVEHGLLDPLGLNPVSVTKINTPSAQDVNCAVYAVRVTLPHNSWIDSSVIQAPENGLAGQPIGALIGRDILRFSVLIYLGHANQFTLSF